MQLDVNHSKKTKTTLLYNNNYHGGFTQDDTLYSYR